MYRSAHSFFGSRNVNVLIHNNQMIELKVQVNTGFRMAMVYFKDSYKFINLPLRLSPKSFDFHNELQKGFFPHYLNTRDNLNFMSDHLPDMKYFGVEEMGEDERNCFVNWYQLESCKFLNDFKLIYDLRSEMVKYCYDDCFVLASAFSHFNELMIRELKSSGVVGIVEHDYTILADFITLPQMVIHWFVGCMMPERTIAVVPNGRYDRGKCGSLKERIWLMYLDVLHEEEEGNNFVPMQSRYCSGEGQHRIGEIFLDGYRVLPCSSRECYEFYGCYYHGCSICFPDRSKVVRCKYRENGYMTVEKAYMNTIEREHLIRHTMDFDSSIDKWIVLWEHEYNEKFEIFKDNLGDMIHDLPGKMNPKYAVKGGCREVFACMLMFKTPISRR